MVHAFEIDSYDMMYKPSYMKTSGGVQTIAKFCLRNLKGCNVGITDGRDLLIMPLRWFRCHNIRTKFHKDWVRN
jgi:hypothetical protein